jgi:acid phosphatase (class A)
MTTNVPTNGCRAEPFPDNGWTFDWKLVKDEPTMLAEGWQSRVRLAPPPEERTCEEIDRLMSLKAARPGLRAEIVQQATSEIDMLLAVQEVLGSVDNPIRLKTKILQTTLVSNLRGPIFHYKDAFHRGRPYHCQAGIDPMFPDKQDRKHPGHPSYPSGHASCAFALAFIYANWYPELEPELLAAAQRVASNREVAGLHFPSDTEAGRLLARRLIDLLMEIPEFERVVSDARGEWPTGVPTQVERGCGP